MLCASRFTVGPPYLSLRQALRACHLPRQREARGGRTQLACGPSAGECRRPIFGNSLAGNLWNSRGPRRACAVCPQSGLRRRVPPSCRREPLCAATEAVKSTGAPAALARWGIRPLSTGGKWTERPPGGLYTKGEMPPGAPRSRSQKQPAFAPQPRVCRGASLFPSGGRQTKGNSVKGFQSPRSPALIHHPGRYRSWR